MNNGERVFIMKITVNEKEYTLKFGYKATVKSGIIKKLANAENGKDNEDGFESIEGILLVLPELLAVGLQVHHSAEFGYNLDTNDGYNEAVDKAYDLIDTWLENKDNSFIGLYNAIENELLNDSFLSSLFQQAVAEEQNSTKKSTTKKK